MSKELRPKLAKAVDTSTAKELAVGITKAVQNEKGITPLEEAILS